MQLIAHFAVVCLVAWPLNESEASVDFVSIETLLLSSVNDTVLMLIARNLHKKSIHISIKTRSTPALLLFKGQATKHTFVKWPIVCISGLITAINNTQVYFNMLPFKNQSFRGGSFA